MPTASDDTIRERLEESTDNHDVEIVSAVIRGSHREGVAHDNSDTGVMMLFANPPSSYAQVGECVKSIHDPDDPVDIHGWDVRKFGHLLGGSNPDAIHYALSFLIFSPMAVNHLGIHEEARDNFNHMKLYHHYLSLATANYGKYIASGKDSVVNRHYHVQRAVANAKYVRKVGEVPPFDTEELLRRDVFDAKFALSLSLLTSMKQGGGNDVEIGDVATGDRLEAEKQADMEPTDERINNPDRDVVNNFIEDAMDSYE